MKARFDSVLSITGKLKTLQHSALFGLSGAAFALGNLLLARTMSVEAFGRVALAFALYNIACLIAPVGLDQVLMRHRLKAGIRLGLIIGASGSLVGATVGTIAYASKGLSAAEATLTAIAIISGGLLVAASGMLRAALRSEAALALYTTGNWIIMAIGCLSLILPMTSALWPLLIFAGGQTCAAALGWIIFGHSYRALKADQVSIPWVEAFSLLNVTAVTALSLQFERLIVPVALDVGALATFSVLASVAVFPFRMVTAGAAFAITPRLRAETNLRERQRLVRTELISISIILITASTAVALAAPFVGSFLTGGRYKLDIILVLAACAGGAAMVLQAVPRAILTACGNAPEFAWMSRFGWVALGLATLGGFIGANWGLASLIVGAAIGNIIGNLPIIMLARRSLNDEGAL